MAIWNHFGRSLVTLGSLSVVFEGVEILWTIPRNFEDLLGGPKVRGAPHRVGKNLIQRGDRKP